MSELNNFKRVINHINENHQLIKNVEICSDGKNSQVFKLTLLSGDKNALKIYPVHDIKRERLNREQKFLTFLKNINYSNCPKVIMGNYKLNFILISWIEGSKIKIPSKNDLENIRKFYQIINQHKHNKNAANLPLASEAFFEIDLLLNHVHNLIHNYKNTFSKNSKYFSMELNLINNLKRDLKEISHIIKSDKNDKINFEINKILSQSDIGFHNIIKNRNGVHFIDFEYSGWDNPMKLLSDWILQPSGFYTFKKPLKFFMNISKEIGINSKMKEKLYQYLLIYRLRWILIKMNSLKDIELDKKNNPNKIFRETENYYKISLKYIRKYIDLDGVFIN